MPIDFVCRENHCVFPYLYRLVVSAGDAKLVKALIEFDAVVLGRAVAYGIDRRGGPATLVMHRHSGVGMFVTLQDQVDAIFPYDAVKDPALNQVVVALNGIERVVQDDDLPFRLALTELPF